MYMSNGNEDRLNRINQLNRSNALLEEEIERLQSAIKKIDSIAQFLTSSIRTFAASSNPMSLNGALQTNYITQRKDRLKRFANRFLLSLNVNHNSSTNLIEDEILNKRKIIENNEGSIRLLKVQMIEALSISYDR